MHYDKPLNGAVHNAVHIVDTSRYPQVHPGLI